MSKIAIIYGSTTGVTEEVASRVAAALGVTAADIHNISEIDATTTESAELLVLGTSTWGSGELQDDWLDGIEKLKGYNLSGKKVAIFGCGDSECYPDTFCDAMGIIYKELIDSGCTFVGSVSTDGYSFDSSAAVQDGRFVGLPLDEVNQSDKTDGRIAAWIASIKG